MGPCCSLDSVTDVKEVNKSDRLHMNAAKPKSSHK